MPAMAEVAVLLIMMPRNLAVKNRRLSACALAQVLSVELDVSATGQTVRRTMNDVNVCQRQEGNHYSRNCKIRLWQRTGKDAWRKLAARCLVWWNRKINVFGSDGGFLTWQRSVPKQHTAKTRGTSGNSNLKRKRNGHAIFLVKKNWIIRRIKSDKWGLFCLLLQFDLSL